MKTKYTKPAIEAVLIKGKQMLLAGSPDGARATMSGYSHDDDEGSGFSQN